MVESAFAGFSVSIGKLVLWYWLYQLLAAETSLPFTNTSNAHSFPSNLILSSSLFLNDTSISNGTLESSMNESYAAILPDQSTNTTTTPGIPAINSTLNNRTNDDYDYYDYDYERPVPATTSGTQLQLVDHIVKTELELVNHTLRNESDSTNLVLVQNGSVIVAAPMSTNDNILGTLLHDNGTGPDSSNASHGLNLTSDIASDHGRNLTEALIADIGSNITATSTTQISTVFVTSPDQGDSSSASPVTIAGGPQTKEPINLTAANLTELIQKATTRQFCNFTTPAVEATPRCLWKSMQGRQMDFWPSRIEVSLCIAFVEKLEQCQVMCESRKDQCRGVDFCPPCVDYNCRLFKEAPDGPTGLKLTNALTFVDFHQKITCTDSL